MKRFIKNGLEANLNLGKQHFYSQFGEDALLQSFFRAESWEKDSSSLGAFGKFKLKKNGFYVDIGAYSPKLYSNTYWFYKKGWSGINIDATPGSMKLFKKIRPRDINLECAISQSEEPLTFYYWDAPCTVNTVSEEFARQWEEKTGKAPYQTQIQSLKLSTVLHQHQAPDEIDFMSVDVEGHDLEVLKSNDWNRFRPKLLLVETHSDNIENIIQSQLYQYVTTQGYKLHSWANPSLLFKRQ